MPAEPVFQTDIPDLELLARGKVRDIYAVDSAHLLIVTTDRLSAYDVVLPQPVPGKGEILTQISNFWFGLVDDLVPNHLSDIAVRDVISDTDLAHSLEPRALVVRRLEPLPIEAVARGYLIGSGWRDYLDTGAVCGIALPPGLEQASRLEEALYTPATKAAVGDHDENIDLARTESLLGVELAKRVRDLTLTIYKRATEHALPRGIVIADTKFEFGLDADGELYLIDEVLTPDSSRFWPLDQYQADSSPPSYDKQFVRDYLDTLAWDKTAPGPSLPEAVLAQTAEKYREALQRLTAPAID